jgi:hypothetical protein
MKDVKEFITEMRKTASSGVATPAPPVVLRLVSHEVWHHTSVPADAVRQEMWAVVVSRLYGWRRG